MRLNDLLAADRIEPALQAADKAAALQALAELLARGADGVPAEQIARVLREREALASTGVGDEVAIPHGKIAGLRQVVAAMALAPQGVEFDSIDHRPVKIFVAILAPERSASDHLRALARCSKLLRDARIRARLIAARSVPEVLEIVRDDGGVPS
jgi:PTS system nitrogen regulatory IIA component